MSPPSSHPIPRTSVDVVIFGGGIAGLWTLAHLRNVGYSCLLIESRALGAGQTIASQGIIHGGVKYALTGAASAASRAIAEMPEMWRASLEGRGTVDLSAARVLSPHQYLWTTAGIGSRLVGVAASKAIRTPVERVADAARPDWATDAPRGVAMYTVAEPVLDPASVLESLAAPHAMSMVLCDPRALGGATTCEFVGFNPSTGMVLRSQSEAAKRDAAADPRFVIGPVSFQDGYIGRITGRHPWRDAILLRRETDGGPPAFQIIETGRVVLAAGAGNAELAEQLNMRFGERGDEVSMQRRPLHMVMARGGDGGLPEVFGHCVGGGLSDKPRVTITSQRSLSGEVVWYIGGAIAEDGVERPPGEQIAAAKGELGKCVPWVDLAGTRWATLRVDRAEGKRSDGSRPDEPVVHVREQIVCVWPTKLAFAPLVARRVTEAFAAGNFTPSRPSDVDAMSHVDGWPRPRVAPLPWNDPEVEWT